MNKLKNLLNDKVFVTILRCIFCLIIGIVAFLSYFFTHERTYGDISTAFFIPACILLFIGFLSCVNHYGGMDFINYGTVTMLSFLKRNPEKPYEDLIDYKEYKNERREFEGPIFLPYFIFGLVFLVVAIIFYVIFKQSI